MATNFYLLAGKPPLAFQAPFEEEMRQTLMHFHSKSGIRVDRIGWEVYLPHENTLWLN
jgi:hypothetical protein